MCIFDDDDCFELSLENTTSVGEVVFSMCIFDDDDRLQFLVLEKSCCRCAYLMMMIASNDHSWRNGVMSHMHGFVRLGV